jgi:hypothetical protein
VEFELSLIVSTGVGVDDIILLYPLTMLNTQAIKLTRSAQPNIHIYIVCPFVSFTHYLFLIEEDSLQEDTALILSLCMLSLLTVE